MDRLDYNEWPGPDQFDDAVSSFLSSISEYTRSITLSYEQAARNAGIILRSLNVKTTLDGLDIKFDPTDPTIRKS